VFEDAETGLIWTGRDSGESLTQSEAARLCERLELEGMNNWRLPTIDELEGIYDPENISGEWAGKPIHTIEGIELTTFYVWSSSLKGEDRAWAFNFNFGERMAAPTERSTNSRSLCVRD